MNKMQKLFPTVMILLTMGIFFPKDSIQSQDLGVQFTNEPIPGVPLHRGSVAPIQHPIPSPLHIDLEKGQISSIKAINPIPEKQYFKKGTTGSRPPIQCKPTVKKLSFSISNQDDQELLQPIKNVPDKINTPKLGWTNIMTQNFEGSFPSGSWAVYGNPSWDDDDFKPHAGSKSAWCARSGSSGRDPASSNYANNMEAWMVYGPFDLSDASEAQLLFYFWNQSVYNEDFFYYFASKDGSNFGGFYTTGNSNGWIDITFDLTDVYSVGNCCGDNSVWIAFLFESNGSLTQKGAFVDDIILQKSSGTSQPNLIADYTPSGWDYPVVASSVSGTHTVGPDLQSGTDTYIDFAFLNTDATIPTSTDIYVYLYDGSTYLSGWYWKGMLQNYYGYVEDYPHQFSAGDHTLKISVDPTNTISESNENDNIYQKTYSWSGTSQLPNLIADYTPSGWDYPIVPSSVSGTHTVGPDLQSGTDTYIDLAFLNTESDISSSSSIYLYLYQGSTYLSGWYWEGLLKDHYGYVEDYAYSFSGGTHTLETVVDPTEVIDESDESDNSYQKSFTWAGTVDLPNLIAEYTPTGWDDPIVASSVAGTNTSSSDLQAGETTYIDFAFVNRDKDVPSGTSIFAYLYQGSTYLSGWYWDGIQQDHYGYVEDFESAFSSGSHSIKNHVDPVDYVSESNENDNIYQKSFVWGEIGDPDISVSPIQIDINEEDVVTLMPDPMGTEDLSINTDKHIHGKGLIIPDEIKEYWKSHKPQVKTYISKLKASIDWSANDSPVKDQKSCGSCWAFSAVGLVENLGTKTDLAEQILVSCISGNDCGGGWFGYALKYIYDNGLPSESCYPYTGTNGNCGNQCSNPAYLEKVQNYDLYGRWGDPTSQTVDNLKTLLQDSPVIVAMLVPNGFSNYTGGIFDYNGGPIPQTNGHAVLVVGYDDDQQYFKVKNSWGDDWGEQGYFRISYNDVTDDVEFGGYACIASGVYTEGEDYYFTIENQGTSTLVIQNISSDKAWLSFSPGVIPDIPPSGKQVVDISVPNWSAVSCPNETAILTIESNDPDEPSVPINVTATPSCVTPPPDDPVLNVTPNNLSFEANEGGPNPSPQTISIKNTKTGVMNWSLTSNAGWLSGNPSSGMTETETDQVTVSVDVSTLTSVNSPYQTTLTVSSPEANNSPQSVNVVLSVLPISTHFSPVDPTGDPRAIIIQNAIIDAQTIESGDEIGVFDGSICVGASTFQGSFPLSITVWMEVLLPNDPPLPGAKNGNSMVFKIWNGSEYGAIPTYETGNGTFGEPLTVINILEATKYTNQTIDVKAGRLNIISFNSLPQNISAEAMFDELSNLVIVQDDAGHFYTPSYNVNTIGELSLSKGYKVYISGSQDDSLTNIGVPLVPQNYTHNLEPSQIFIIGYPYQNPFPIDQVFDPIASSIVVVQDDEGNFWVPSQNVNTIGNMKPGKGYKIYVNQEVPFTYPVLNSVLAKEIVLQTCMKPQPSNTFHFQQTGLPYAIIISNPDLILEHGDEVGVFDSDQCVGGILFDGQNPLILAAWESDHAYGLSGFEKGSPISIQVWKSKENRSFKVSGHFESLNDSRFRLSPFSIFTFDKQSLDFEIPQYFLLEQNFPNPFNPETSIRYHLPESCHVNLNIYSLNGKHIRNLKSAYSAAGSYRVTWNGKNDLGQQVAGGLYLCKMTAGKFKTSMKLILIR